MPRKRRRAPRWELLDGPLEDVEELARRSGLTLDELADELELLVVEVERALDALRELGVASG